MPSARAPSAPSDRSRRRLLVTLPGLVGATVLSLAILGLRIAWTGTDTYEFLVWNLFLAWLPVVFAAAAVRLPRRGLRLLSGVAWLLFFPNAPYIVTDFVHLHIEGTRHLAIDLPLLFAFAAAGMLLAIASLRTVHDAVAARLGAAPGWLFAATVAALTGFGVYLGRVLDFNSWDAIAQPSLLVAQVVPRLADPLAHQKMLAGTLLFAACFLAVYARARLWLRPPRRAG